MSSYQQRLEWRRRHDLRATNLELTRETFARIERNFPGEPKVHVLRRALNELLERTEKIYAEERTA
jgi:hypothetical protein